MIVFSNTTPFIALSACGRLELLPKLFGIVHVVQEVLDECAHGGPVEVPALTCLSWIKVVTSQPVPPGSMLLELDRGEQSTISTALAMNASKVIIDEKIGRNSASSNGC